MARQLPNLNFDSAVFLRPQATGIATHCTKSSSTSMLALRRSFAASTIPRCLTWLLAWPLSLQGLIGFRVSISSEVCARERRFPLFPPGGRSNPARSCSLQAVEADRATWGLAPGRGLRKSVELLPLTYSPGPLSQDCQKQSSHSRLCLLG